MPLFVTFLRSTCCWQARRCWASRCRCWRERSPKHRVGKFARRAWPKRRWADSVLNVSDLGEVLELMHTSSQRWSSLAMDGFEWRNLKAFARAWEHHLSELHKSQSVQTLSAFRVDGIDGREPAEESREPWRIWLAKPDRRKAQFQVGDELVTAVFVGNWWWGWSPSAGFRTNGGASNASHGFGPAEALVDPASHLTSLDMRVDGRITFLSRPAFRVTAAPRVNEPAGFNRTLHMLGTGADEYQLVVDAEVGVLLRTEARYQGDAFRVIETGQIAIDESLGDKVFDPDLLRAGITDP
jgi:hypothetical protein